jgi:hypothetical protein
VLKLRASAGYCVPPILYTFGLTGYKKWWIFTVLFIFYRKKEKTVKIHHFNEVKKVKEGAQ